MRPGYTRKSRKIVNRVNNEEEKITAVLEVAKKQGVVEIELDQAAIDQLISDLKSLREPSDHFHYFSEEWGGYNLTLRSVRKGQMPVHHIKITKV